MPPRKVLWLSGLLLALAEPAAARPACSDRSPERRPFFGDLHVHTALSLDASTQDTRARPEDAYRFARGERIPLQPFLGDGTALRDAQLERPLDFAAVTDHAELLGEVAICRTPGMPGHDSAVCRIYRRWPRVAFFWMNFVANRADRHRFCGADGSLCREAARRPWVEIREAAAAHDDPCHFTSFVAYEWTGAEGTGNNLHRNVVFASDEVPALPASFVETPTPPLLWDRLRSECTEAGTGCDVVVIPHNANLGAGRMFRSAREDGSPIDREEAEGRARFETLVEVMQHKGDSECHPAFSNDESCGFEKLAMNSFGGRYARFLAQPPVARQFVRHTLAEGLAHERRLGVNPFRFGLIGSTDTHLGAPGLVEERADYPGHGGAGTPVDDETEPGLPDPIDFNPGGLAVLWAEENTRPALFSAMKRREAYGTSGPRLVVRFFGAWRLPEGLCSTGGLVAAGYENGVPMGGTLPPRPEGVGAPVFAVSALRDPSGGAPLQRAQIVKGWSEGETVRERVFDVAGGDNGADVDLASCEPRGTGADHLCSVWQDPEFDADQGAFYYLRVLENPVCRWSQQLCLAAGVDCADGASVPEAFESCCSEEHVRSVQERAWSSPIWYAP